MRRFMVLTTVYAAIAIVLEASTAADDREIQMKKLEQALVGTWQIVETDEPSPGSPKGESYNGKEIWSAPGGGPVMEQFQAKSSAGEEAETALFWWDTKTGKYHGIWCAPINDEGCNGFEAKWDGNRLLNDGEWTSRGHRLAWHEVFEFAAPSEFVQTLYIGEPGAEQKLVSTIRGNRVATDKP